MIIRIHSYTKHALIPMSGFLNVIQIRHEYIYIGKTRNLPFMQRNLDRCIANGFLELFTTWSRINLNHERHNNLTTDSTWVCFRIPITKRKGTTTPQPKCLFDVLRDTQSLVEESRRFFFSKLFFWNTLEELTVLFSQSLGKNLRKSSLWSFFIHLNLYL